MSGPVVALVAAAGAGWEAPLLAALSGRRDVVVLKRCVDVEDLLASATTGQAAVAVVGLDAVGLDAAALDRLRALRVAPVVVGPGPDDPAAERAQAHADRVGARRVLPQTDVEALVEAMAAEGRGTSSEPPPATPPTSALPGSSPLAVLDETSGALVPGGPDRRVHVVWGPAGAPGRTTLAVGLAASLAASGRRCVLVDADPQGGTVALQLGVVEEVSGLLAAARLDAAGRLEAEAGALVRGVGAGWGVVTGLPRADRWAEVRVGVLERLLAALAAEADVVVDVGASLEDDPTAELAGRPPRQQLTLEALAAADAVVAVGTPDPVGLARLARGVAELREIGVRPEVAVLNRMRGTLAWSEREIVATLRGVLAGAGEALAIRIVPDDPSGVDRAQAAGAALVDADGPAARAVRALAAHLVGAPEPPASGGRLRRRTAGRGRRR